MKAGSKARRVRGEARPSGCLVLVGGMQMTGGGVEEEEEEEGSTLAHGWFFFFFPLLSCTD